MSNDAGRPLDTKARLFRALGDPSRLAVLEALRNGARCVSELVTLTGLSQPNVSGHLSFVRDCGLVEREQRGRFAYYSLSSANAEGILALADEVMSRFGGPSLSASPSIESAQSNDRKDDSRAGGELDTKH
jgi:ArsR family transcriptional regulator, cadmium/lead-responsive transcriptional repressor